MKNKFTTIFLAVIVSVLLSVLYSNGATIYLTTTTDTLGTFRTNVNSSLTNLNNSGPASTSTLTIAGLTITGFDGIASFINGLIGTSTILSPLNYTTTTNTFSIATSTASTSGFLTSTDWNTFNTKITTSSLSSTATGLTYTSNTGVFSWTTGYEGLKEASSTAWNAKQEALVSGTNIKTINSTSLLGSGDLSISASPGGSNTQIQFNNNGVFGGDSNLIWSSSTKKFSITSDINGATIFEIINNWASSSLKYNALGNLTAYPTSASSSNIGIADLNNYSNLVGISLRSNVPSLNFGTGAVAGEDLFLVRRSGDLTFEFGTTPSEKVRITSSGSVGIGTSTPAHSLVVNGNIQISSSTAKVIYPDSTSQATGFKDFGVNVSNATTSATATTTLQKQFFQAITISQLTCSTNGSNISITAERRASSTPETAGTSMLTTFVCGSTGNSTSSIATSTIPALGILNFNLVSVPNSTTTLRIYGKYTEN